MSQVAYKPIADGVYENAGGVICVGRGQSLSVSKKQPRMKIWVGELPGGWRLCQAVEGPKAEWSQAPDWAQWWTCDPNDHHDGEVAEKLTGIYASNA